MRVLVTGNLGYIGCVMTEVLQAGGHEVIGLDNGLFIGYDFVPKPFKTTRIKQIIKDTRDATEEDLKGADAVVHLAALSNDPIGELNPELTLDINYRATIKIAELAKKQGIKRFVFSSSCSMYGKGDADLRDENSPTDPLTAYAKSKVLSEKDLSSMADEKFSPVYMRNATVCGVSPRMRMDLVVNNLAASARLFKEIRVLSDGTPWRPNVHVRDLCKAFLLALEADKEIVHNRAFNVGHEAENLQVKEIAEQTAKVFGYPVKILAETAGDPRSYRVNFSRIRNELNFQPDWTTEKALIELKEVFDKRGLTEEDFISEYWVTLKRYKNLIEKNEIGDDLRISV